MKKVVILVTVLAVAAVAYGFLTRGDEGSSTAYRLVKIEKGNLEAVVSSTGTLEAVTTVEVGTQVSGRIAQIMADFNDHVEKGQVIARIDPTLLQSAVADAQAGLQRSQADRAQAQRNFDRLQALHQQGIAADADYSTAEYQLDVAKAGEREAEIALERAKQNLEYATIIAPVSGTVVERDVDVGQTVAASFSSPRLFLIANDLAHMQIIASVDESDIGLIKDGQKVRFNVKAYPDDTFNGFVKQVRLKSTIDQNVVSYDVVVDVQNPEGRLLPGMTATVEFLVNEAQDVLKVANAALRFRPSEADIAAARERMQKERAERNGAQGTSGQPQQGGPGAWGQGGGAHGRQGARDMAVLWSLDAAGQLTPVPVRTGITDGQFTQVTGRRVQEGMDVIAGITLASQSTGSNPFQGNNQQRHRPGGF